MTARAGFENEIDDEKPRQNGKDYGISGLSASCRSRNNATLLGGDRDDNCDKLSTDFDNQQISVVLCSSHNNLGGLK
jgi:hypothetical protein